MLSRNQYELISKIKQSYKVLLRRVYMKKNQNTHRVTDSEKKHPFGFGIRFVLFLSVLMDYAFKYLSL